MTRHSCHRREILFPYFNRTRQQNTTIYTSKHAEKTKFYDNHKIDQKITKATRRWLIVFSPRRVASTHGRGQDRTPPYLLSSETTAKGTGLEKLAGKEDPVELDSSLAL